MKFALISCSGYQTHILKKVKDTCAVSTIWQSIEEMMDIISPINNSIALLRRLKEISDNVKVAEIRNVIADLSNELADVKLAAADLKEQIAALREENAEIKHQKAGDEKPAIKWGCYYFDGDESRLYCTACYDTKGQKNLTNRATSRWRMCPVCKATIGK
jgi:hypothetical protein